MDLKNKDIFQNEEEMKECFGVENPEEAPGDIIGLMNDNTPAVFKNILEGRQLNDIYFGAAGSGKTGCVVKPKILRSFKEGKSVICTDTGGDLYASTRDAAIKAGYNVKVLNLGVAGVSQASKFNPLKNISARGDNGHILNVVTSAIFRDDEYDEFWTEMKKTLLKMAILHVCRDKDEIKAGHNNLSYIYEFLTKTDVSDYKGIFDGIDEYDPEVKYYETFSLASMELQKKVLVGLCVKMQTFAYGRAQEIFSGDDFDPADFTRGKAICYIEIPVTDTTLSPIAAMFISEMMARMMLPASETGATPVRFILDELPWIGKVYELKENFAIGKFQFTLICQAIEQIRAIYGEEADLFFGCCVGFGLLGGINTHETLKHFARMINWQISFENRSALLKNSDVEEVITPEDIYDLVGADEILFLRYRRKPAILKKYFVS